MKRKTIIILTIIVVLIIAGIIICYALLSPRHNYPSGGLNSVADEHKYIESLELEQQIQVEQFVMDAPLKALNTSSLAFLYPFFENSMLCITEISPLDTDEQAINDTLEKGGVHSKSTKLVKKESGYLNSYKWTYLCAEAKETEEYSIVMYRTSATSSYDLVIATIYSDVTDETIEKGVQIQKNLIHTMSTIGENDPESKQSNANYESKYDKYEDFQQFYDCEISKWKDIYVTQQYEKHVVADDDYENLRLSVCWIDTSIEPRELRLYSKQEGLEYEPVEQIPGRWTYIISNVAKGDHFTVYFDMVNPTAITFTQEEESEYEAYYERDEEDFFDFKED